MGVCVNVCGRVCACVCAHTKVHVCARLFVYDSNAFASRSPDDFFTLTFMCSSRDAQNSKANRVNCCNTLQRPRLGIPTSHKIDAAVK